MGRKGRDAERHRDGKRCGDVERVVPHSCVVDKNIKSFPDKVKLEEFIITKLLLYEMLKGLI